MSATSRRKLLLIGWDGADWKLINPLLDAGLMPTLAELVERGVMAKLSSLPPMVSPLLWTSLATGVRADKHRILGRAELDVEVGTLRSITRTRRQAPPIWTTLHQYGRRGHVINWPASHPMEDVGGVFVSDRYRRIVAPLAEPWPLESGTIAPERVADVLGTLRVHPGELIGEQLLPFLPNLDRINQAEDPRVIAIAEILAETASVHAAATWALEHEPWDFAAVHYGGLEQIGHLFMRYHPPQLPDTSDEEFEIYRDVVTAGYRFHDLLLERLIQLAGEDTTVMLVSDHGFCSGEFRPRDPRASHMQWHRGQGIFCLAGPDIRRDEFIHQANILDVAPTVLTLFGLPLGVTDGRPLLSAWTTPPEIVAGGLELPPATRTPVDEAPSRDQLQRVDALAELDALGYADNILPIQEALSQAIGRIEDYHLALVHQAAGRPEVARDLLRDLLAQDPENTALRLYLATCHYQLGEYSAAREVASAIADDEMGSHERDLLFAIILIAEGRPEESLDQLHAASQTRLREPQVFGYIGQACLQLDRYADAEAAFNRALSIDEDFVGAHFGLAVCFARQRRWDDAADASLSVVGLNHHYAGAHFLLGIALVHLERPARAITAFEIAIGLRPNWPAPRAWAARLHHQMSSPVGASLA